MVLYGQGGQGSSDQNIAGSTCDFIFDLDESYLVYAFEAEENGKEYLTTSICSGTRSMAEAEADLDALGPPSVALSGGELVPTGGSPLVAVTAVALLALLLAAAGSLVRARR